MNANAEYHTRVYHIGVSNANGRTSIFEVSHDYSESLKLRTTFPGPTYLDKQAGIEHFS